MRPTTRRGLRLAVKKVLMVCVPPVRAVPHVMMMVGLRQCGFRVMLNKLFDDHRVLMLVLWCWLALVLALFTEMGLMRSEFVRFGPSEYTEYVGIKLDTWRKWSMVAVFTALSSFMNDFANESLEPLFINVMRDPKQKYIPYSKMTCVLITQLWTVYGSIMSLFSLYTYFSQLDLLLVKLVVALLVGQYSTLRYLRNKVHEPVKFAKYYEQVDEESEDASRHIVDASARDGQHAATLPGAESSLPLGETLPDKLTKAVLQHATP